MKYYNGHFKRQVVNYALKYNGNHAAYKYKLHHSIVYAWLRGYGLESAIGKYFRKR